MKKNFLSLLSSFLIFVSCTNGITSCAENKKTQEQFPGQMPGQTTVITDDGSTTNYTDKTTAPASAVIAEDLYENFVADGTVKITFNGTSWTTSFEGAANADEISIKKVENSAEDEASQGVEIQYKGKSKIKYVLSGTYTGTVFIKNKKADAAVVLNNVNITSADGSGPVLRFSTEETRTFIVVPAGTTNTLTDTRLLNQSGTMYDDKKGSIYAKGALIFTGESSTKAACSATRPSAPARTASSTSRRPDRP